MNAIHGPVTPVLLAAAVAATGLATAAPADVPSQEKTIVALATGSVGSSGQANEAVVFGGQATISGKVILDPHFGAPPVLEVIVDLSAVQGKGVQTGKAYLVSTQAVLHRPLQSFETFEISFPFVPDGNVLKARSARATFGVSYSPAKGMTSTPVRITQNPN